jgi:uncharacterized surface anchored protein
MIHTRLTALMALGATAVLAAACGPAVLDDGKLQDVIATDFAKQTQVEVQSVDCPNDQKIAAGATFTCTLTAADGTKYTIEVTQTDDKGNIHWKLLQPGETPGAGPAAS